LRIAATFSIVAFDPETDALGVAVQSKFLAADDEALLDALGAFIRTENFEEREQERGYLDRAALEFMKERR
jgi:Putative peptidoglycan binding domain